MIAIDNNNDATNYNVSVISDNAFVMTDSISVINDSDAVIDDSISVINDNVSVIADNVSVITDNAIVTNNNISVITDNIAVITDNVSMNYHNNAATVCSSDFISDKNIFQPDFDWLSEKNPCLPSLCSGMLDENMIVRSADIADAAQIARIYNYYIENSIATFEVEAIDASEMANRMREIFDKNYPFFVAEADGEVVAYAYASTYKSRCAYLHSVEVSVYARHDAGGAGIGTKLYEKLFAALKESNKVHAVIAGISLPNAASVRLHEKFGMEKVAHFREVGWKFEKWIDVGYWELINRQSSIVNHQS